MARPVDTVLARPLTRSAERALVAALERAKKRAELDAELLRRRPEIAALDAPSDPFVVRLARVLEDATPSLRLEFWRDMHGARPEIGLVAACYGDALIDAGREPEALEVLLASVEREAENLALVDDQLAALMERADRATELRYRLVTLRAELERAASDPDDPGVEVREHYSELLEEYADDATAVAAIRALGQRIRELEDEGVLPSVLVRRGEWRKP